MTEFTLIIALCAVAGVGLSVWLKSPWRSLLGWVALLSVQVGVEVLVSDFRPALSDLFVPSMAIGALLYSVRKGDRWRTGASSLSMLVLLFAATFLTVGNLVAFVALGTLPQWTWLNKDVGLLDLIVCYFALLRLLDTHEKLHTVAKVFVLSGSVINLVAITGGIARYVFGIPNMMMRDETSMRLAGFMVNPGSYGGFILSVLLLQLALLMGHSSLLLLSRRVQWLNVVLLGTACIMTLSRSAQLGLAVGMIALVAFYRLKAGVRLVAFSLVILIALGTLAYWYAFSPKVASGFWNYETYGQSVLLRVDSNRIALDMLLEKPAGALTGIGVGTFLVRSQEKFGGPLIIHNDFLWLLVETGVFGFLLFAGIVLRSLHNCLRVARSGTEEGPIAVGIACAIVGTLGWMLGTEGLWHRHVWFLLALSEACYRLSGKAKALSFTQIMNPPQRERYRVSLKPSF